MNETQLQAACVTWFGQSKYRWEYEKCFFKVNNNAPTYKAQMQERSTGLVAGVSDMILVLHGAVVFIEFKVIGGVQSQDQKVFQDKVQSKGHFYFIITSLESFQNTIKTLIDG